MRNTFTIAAMLCNGCRTKAEKALSEIAIQLNFSNVDIWAITSKK